MIFYLQLKSNSKLLIVVSIIYLIFFFSLSSGLINAILEGENLPNNLTFIPSRSFQTMSETIILVIILFVGTIGTFLLYQSGKVLTLKGTIWLYNWWILCNSVIFSLRFYDNQY